METKHSEALNVIRQPGMKLLVDAIMAPRYSMIQQAGNLPWKPTHFLQTPPINPFTIARTQDMRAQLLEFKSM